MNIKCPTEEGLDCPMEERITEVVERFGRLAEKLSDNQVEIRMSIVKLTENMHELQRVHERVDIMEGDLKRLTPLVYKMVGVTTTAALVIPLVVTYLIERMGV